MEYISQWVTNIILFILLAIIIDLLIPNSSLHRYIKMVVGLLLIAVILTPVLNILNADMDDLIKGMQVESRFGEKNIKNSIENKKDEIQASQRAYILEEVAVQMKNQVKEDVENSYDIQIKNIEITLYKEAKEFSIDEMSSVKVFISELQEEHIAENPRDAVKKVEKVMVDTSTPIKEEVENKSSNKHSDMQNFLAEKWQISEDIIEVIWEEG